MNRIHSADLSTGLLRERIFNKFNSSTTIITFKNFWKPRIHIRCGFTSPQCGMQLYECWKEYDTFYCRLSVPHII